MDYVDYGTYIAAVRKMGRQQLREYFDTLRS
jgi:hypothetical protein